MRRVGVTLTERELITLRLAMLRARDFWSDERGRGAELIAADYQRLYDLFERLLQESLTEENHVGSEDKA